VLISVTCAQAVLSWRIPYYTLLYRIDVLSFNCGLSITKYRHRQWK